MTETEQGGLFGTAAGNSDMVVINGRCLVRSRDGHRVVVVSGIVLAQYAVGDRMAESYALVHLMDGHVRVYHGKRVLPKAHVARMRLSMSSDRQRRRSAN
jgi:hypothetical protein